MIKGTDVVSGRRVPCGSLTVAVWDDMADAVDDIINGEERPDMASRDTTNGGWSGTPNFGDAVELFKSGWSEHSDRMEMIAAEVARHPAIEQRMAERFTTTFDYAGGMADISRYISGEPECMIAPMMTSTVAPAPVIRILVNGFVSGGVPAARLIDRGIAIAALVDTLQKLGHSVELWWHVTTKPVRHGRSRTTTRRDGGPRMVNMIKVAFAGEPMDANELLFMFAHPSSFRRLGFAIGELRDSATRDKYGYKASSGYGMPGDLTNEEAETICGGPVHIRFGAMSSYDNYRDAAAHVISHLDGLNL